MIMDKLVITRPYREKNITAAYGYEEGKLEEAAVLGESLDSPGSGDIFIGKVKNIIKNIESAFIDVGSDVCFISLDELKDAQILNRVPSVTGDVKVGDEVAVQIVADRQKKKNPRGSVRFTFSGDYVVLKEEKRPAVKVSLKITDPEIRQTLTDALEPYADRYSFILRSNAATVPIEQVISEAESFINRTDAIRKESKSRSYGSLLYKSQGKLMSMMKLLKNHGQIVTDRQALYSYLLEMKNKLDKEITVKFYDDPLPLSALYDLRSVTDRILSRKVSLRSGGYLYIETTEAMTVVDVNSGKSISDNRSRDDKILAVNMEACRAIARHLRVRNYSGIIVIDFIDMKRKEDKLKVVDYLRKLFARDHIATRVVDITALGLVEVTRRKIYPSFYESFLQEDK